jgi:methionyl-tRNA formyltransferase
MPSMAPLVFFGTPEFALPTLAALVEAGRSPLCVVTQPARPTGRGQQAQEPPVARWAARHGLAVLQPARVRAAEFLAELRPLDLAVAVVVAFGQIFPAELLALPRHGCLNLHASLLPSYRGAAPIQAALAAGEPRTGVTIMQMEAGLDSGPILLQEEIPIGAEETAGELAPRLAQLGARLMLAALAGLESGGLVARPQDAALATYAPRLSRDSGRADWSLAASDLRNRLRAYTPWPGLTASLHGAPVKLLRAAAPDGTAEGTAAALPAVAQTADSPPPGTYLGRAADGLLVACGHGTTLAVLELQRPGRKAQRGVDFANGERLRPGDRFD